jgi:hypothetical protein
MDPEAPLEGTGDTKKGESEEEGMETDPTPSRGNPNTMTFMQINLHHSKAASTVLRWSSVLGMQQWCR